MRGFCRLHGMVAVVCVVLACPFLQAEAQEVSTVCRVNDLASGWWRRIQEGAPCLFPGERDPESPWVNNPSPPSPQNPDGRVYRIEGNYRLSVVMCVRGFVLTPPPERELCITDYAEAYTEASCAVYQAQFPSSIYTSSGHCCLIDFATDKHYVKGFQPITHY